MDHLSFDQALNASAPRTIDGSASIEREVTFMIEATQHQEITSRRVVCRSPLRRGLIVGGVSLAALGLTAGTIASLLPGSYEAKATVPIEYVTMSGYTMQCEATVSFFQIRSSESPAKIDQFVQQRDWTGFGQHVYDESIANPNPWGDTVNLEHGMAMGIVMSEEFREVFETELPDFDGQYSGAGNNCIEPAP